MPTNRSYEIITTVESAGSPTLAPLPVGNAESSQDALSLDGLTALGFPANSVHVIVGNIASLKAIDANIVTTSLIDGTLCIVSSNGQMYRYFPTSSAVDNGYSVLTPTNNAGARWIIDQKKEWVLSSVGATLTNNHEVVWCNTTGANQTYVLPQALANQGKKITFVKNSSDTYKAVIQAYAGEFIQKGSGLTASFDIQTNSESYTLMSDGGGWLIISHYRDPQIGDQNSDGDWRLFKSGTSMFVQRRESSTWVNKHEFEA